LKDRLYHFFALVGEYALYGLLFSLAVSNALVECFALLMLIGFLGRKIIKPDFSYLKFWPNIFLVLFLLFGSLSLFNSGDYLNKSIHALLGKWMQYWGICIIAQDNLYDQKIVKRGIWAFLFGASLAVFSGLSQYYLGIEFLRNRAMLDATSKGTFAITSSFSHFNGFGGYLVIVLPLIAVSLISNNAFSFRAAGLVVLFTFSTIAMTLTLSRGSWLASLFSFIFLFAFTKKNLKWLILVLIVIIIMFTSTQLLERLSFAFKGGGDNGRLIFWSIALRMIHEHPFFGLGLGTFMANMLKYISRSDMSYAHNCYLQIWAETGIFNLLSFICFVFFLIYFGIKKFLRFKDFLLLGLLSGFIGFLIHSFFDVNLYSLRLAVLFWLWVGLIIAKLRNPVTNNQ